MGKNKEVLFDSLNTGVKAVHKKLQRITEAVNIVDVGERTPAEV